MLNSFSANVDLAQRKICLFICAMLGRFLPASAPHPDTEPSSNAQESQEKDSQEAWAPLISTKLGNSNILQADAAPSALPFAFVGGGVSVERDTSPPSSSTLFAHGLLDHRLFPCAWSTEFLRERWLVLPASGPGEECTARRTSCGATKSASRPWNTSDCTGVHRASNFSEAHMSLIRNLLPCTHEPRAGFFP